MNTATAIAINLSRAGYDLSTRNAAIMALEEDLGYSEEEAVSLADEIVKAARKI